MDIEIRPEGLDSDQAVEPAESKKPAETRRLNPATQTRLFKQDCLQKIVETKLFRQNCLDKTISTRLLDQLVTSLKRPLKAPVSSAR